MSDVCATISGGTGTYTFSVTDSAGRQLELVTWAVTHKDGAAYATSQPSWASIAEGTGSFSGTDPSGYVYTLPLVLTLTIAEAFPWEDRNSIYTMTYTVRRKNCDDDTQYTCTFTIALPTTCFVTDPPLEPTEIA